MDRDANPEEAAASDAAGANERLRALLDLASGLVLLTAIWALGEGIARLLPRLPLPGSVWGMLLLFALLASGRLPEARVQRASALLVRWLGLLFAPVGVGIVAYGDRVLADLPAILAAIVIGSVLTLQAAAIAARRVKGAAPSGPTPPGVDASGSEAAS